MLHRGTRATCPQELMVLGGKKHKLKEIKDVKIPSTVNGAVLLVENLKVYYPTRMMNHTLAVVNVQMKVLKAFAMCKSILYNSLSKAVFIICFLRVYTDDILYRSM
ncbi:hypothetical protein EB796_011993 [Bugula neritina]|uniref:Uncharacterized protein n=1 Tax=Bugula neritina TaxID=10212 RepID=A0A7J7JTF8_BUGNE|nr:hypothetical protein EB796_011993 [Bugula neritina]